MKHPVAGHFIDTAQTDVCFIANGVATLCLSPESLGTYSSIPTSTNETINDIATATGTGPNGLDALVTVGSEGLRLRAYSTSLKNLDWTTLSTNANWMGAKLVRAGDLDGTGTLDFAGVGSTGLFVVCRFNGASQAPRFTVPNSILDIQLVQWDSDLAMEIAVLTTWGVYIYESTGTLDASFARPGASGGAIAVVHVAGRSTDVVEWLSPSSTQGNNPSLYELAPGVGNATQLIADLGQNYTRMAAADMPPRQSATPDGSSDLMMIGSANSAPVFFRQQASSPSFVLSDTLLVDPGGLGCQQWEQLSSIHDSAGPQDFFFGDLNGDGLPDLMVGVVVDPAPPPTGGPRYEYLRCRNGISLPGNLNPSLVYMNAAIDDLDLYGRKVYLQLNTDKSSLPYGTIMSNANCIDVNVWCEFLGGDNKIHITSPASQRYLVPITIGPGLSTTVSFHVPQSIPCFGSVNELYWIEVRYVQVDSVTAPTTVSQAGGAFISYLGTDIPLLNSCYVPGQSSALIVMIPQNSQPCQTNTGLISNCGNSNAFPRGPGHATRPSIRRDDVGTIPLPSASWELAEGDTFPLVPPWH